MDSVGTNKKTMIHGTAGLYIFNCDNKRCFYGTGIWEQTKQQAEGRAEKLGWKIRAGKHTCPECGARLLREIDKQAQKDFAPETLEK